MGRLITAALAVILMGFHVISRVFRSFLVRFSLDLTIWTSVISTKQLSIPYSMASLDRTLRRVFDEELARVFNEHKNGNTDLRSKSFRIRNNNDLVTKVPFPLYRHIGQEIYFDRT